MRLKRTIPGRVLTAATGSRMLFSIGEFNPPRLNYDGQALRTSYFNTLIQMRKLFFFLWAVAYSSLLVQAQDSAVQQYGDKITAADLKEYLSILASDAMEGRETGTRGQKMAAAFIRAHFQEIGLQGPVDGNYFQSFNLYKNVPGDIYVQAAKQKFSNYDNVIYYGNADSEGDVSVPLVYAGLGREEDFEYVDVKDKAVLIRINDGRLYSLPEAARARQKGAKIVFVWNTNSAQEFSQLARQAKASDYGERVSAKKSKPDPVNAGAFVVSSSFMETVFGKQAEELKNLAAESAKKRNLKKLKPVIIQYKTSTKIMAIETENVLGFLEGTDKKDEVMVVSAHYDHIGKLDEGKGDLINNGADDDGSGTVTVMELAKIFAQAKKDGKGPRRSILFMTVTGEEKGLLGSDYYTQHPVFPLANTVVDLNIDMVGRRDAEHKNSPPYVYVIGSDKLSSELHKLSERINSTYTKLVFDYTYNDESHPTRLYYRSDHWNFAKNNIPIIFYFDGIHEDYHKPSDEVDKIEFDLLAKRAQCVFYTAWEIANREGRIVPDVK